MELINVKNTDAYKVMQTCLVLNVLVMGGYIKDCIISNKA